MSDTSSDTSSGTPVGALPSLPDALDDGAYALAALAVLEQVGADLSASLDIDEALRRVVAAVVPSLADWCAIDLLTGDGADTVDGPALDDLGLGDPAGVRSLPDLDVVNEVERRRVRTAVAHRDPAKQAMLWRMAEIDGERPGSSVVPRSLLSGEAVLLERLTPEMVAARTAGSPELAEIFAVLDNRAGAIVPLRARGRVIGALTLSTTGESTRPFGRRELAVAQMLAARAALAVDNARLFAAESAERERTAALAEAGVALGTSLDRDAVLDVLLGLVVPRVGDHAFVLLPRQDDPDGLRAVVARHRDPALQPGLLELTSALDVRRGGIGPGTAWATGRTQLHRISDAALRDAAFRDRPDQARTVAALAVTSSVHVPLLAGDRFFGVLSVTRGAGSASFTDAEARHLTEVGRRATLALANAVAYEEERRIANELQRALLPQELPAVPGLQLCGRYLAGDGGRVGGDWYDAVPLPDGRLGLCVGDVMGRGIRAAAVMGQLRAAMRGYAVEGHPPREVLHRLAGFVRLLEGDQFATCLYAVHDPASGVTTMASAGHPAPLVLPAFGRAAHQVDVVPGLPLGVGDPRSVYADTHLRLDVGSTLVLFTDGLVEGRHEAFDMGLGRLAEGLTAARPVTADAACAAALRVTGRERGHDDDTAVLALRVLAPVTPGSGSDPGTGAGGAGDGTDGSAAAGARSTRLRLTAEPQAASTARRHAVGALARWGADDLVDTVSLLLSELVANAVRHGHGPIDIHLEDGPDALVVRVGDASPQPPRTPGPPDRLDLDAVLDLSENGRGLLLVEALADEWGWAPRTDSGKDVWFRLAHTVPAG